MPLTSLAAQLKKLEAPQTKQLIHRKTRSSLLFDPREAAEIDRDTFYELGVSGLEELKKLNPHFSAFENTLFDATSKSFERSIETSETNQKLDHHIQTFLTLLSPYFLLKPAHKALEWLINRYHIEDFNVNDVLFLCLPYHETSMFGRLLAILRIDKNDPSWCWLKPVQEKSSPLSKTALLNRAATDMAFLKFVCNMPAKAIKVHGNKASSLGTLYAFYCTTVIGSLEYASPVTELHVSHLLPSVLSGLASSILDFTASAYMIIARLTTKIGIGNKLLQGLYNKIAKVEHQKLRAETTLILVLLAQNNNNDSGLPERALWRLVSGVKWFVPNLATLCKNQVVVTPLVVSVLSSALKVYVESEEKAVDDSAMDPNNEEQQQENTSIVNTTEQEQIKQFVNRLLNEVHFEDNDDSEQIFRCLLEAYNVGCGRDKRNWFVGLLRSFEHKYPTAYDNVVSSALASSGTKSSLAVKRLLGENTSRNDLFQKLIHPNPDVRIAAIQHIGQHFKPSKVAWLRESLEDRLSDSCERVVEAMLELPEGLLMSIAPKTLLEHLVQILVRWRMNDHSNKSILRTVNLILGFISQQENRALIALLLFPFLVDSTATQIHQLLCKSSAVDSWPFLQKIRDKIAEGETASEIIWGILEGEQGLLPRCDEIAKALEYIEHATKKLPNVYRFAAILLTAAGIPIDAESSLISSVITNLIQYMKSPELFGDEDLIPMDESTFESWVLASLKDDILPLQGVLYCLSTLGSRMPPEPPAATWINFEEKYNSLVLASFRVIVEGLTSPSKDIRKAFQHVSEGFFENYFTSPEELVKFLMSSLLFENSLGSVCLSLVLRKLEQYKNLGNKLLAKDSILVSCLLLFMNSSKTDIRTEALKILTKLATPKYEKTFYKPFLDQLFEHKLDIEMDPDQVAVVVYTKLSPSKEVKSLLSPDLREVMAATLDCLITIILAPQTPLLIKAKLLQLMESVNSKELCLKLIPLVQELIGGQKSSLSNLESMIVFNILGRLNESTVSCFSHPDFWDFVSQVIDDQSTKVQSSEGKSTVPALILMNQISKQLFNDLPSPLDVSQERLLGMLLAQCAESENIQVLSGLASLFKRILLNSKTVVALFTPMLTVTLPQQQNQQQKAAHKRRLSRTPMLELLETSEWKRGVCLLELIQGKKKLTNVQLLLPRLFEILNKCLMFEQQAPVEYTKQLVLSLVLHCCQELSADALESRDLLQVDLIVQCVRASHNPQTHHHALLALTHMAHLLPEQVLHNIMAIFTFIGSSVLRQDDAYSFQIISKIVDTIVPILVQKRDSGNELNEVAGVMRVFVAAMMDIPDHRRQPLFCRLLNTLNKGEYLWLYLCLVFDSHVRPSSTQPQSNQTDEKNKSIGGEHGSMPRKLEVSLQLCFEFPPEVILNTCFKLLAHLIFMPHDKDESIPKDKYASVKTIFDVESSTGKQLRHYKYTLLMFLSSLISSQNFVQQIASLSDYELKSLEPVFSALIEQCLSYVKNVTRIAEENSNPQSAKYWKAMLNQSYDVLDKTNALLPTELFLSVIGSLLKEGEDSVLRRKAMELIGWKLQDGSVALPEGPLLDLVDPIVEIINSIQPASEHPSQESQLSHQTALFAMKLITRHIATSNVPRFQQILGIVSDILSWKKSANWCVVGSLVLCLAELVSTLKAHSIVSLPKFMPAVIKIMSKQLEQQESESSGELLMASVVTGLLKIVEVLARFLSPYLSQLLYLVCVISSSTASATSSASTEHGVPSQVSPLVHKLKAIRTKISDDVESRVLVPAVAVCYSRLIEDGNYKSVAPLMSVLSESFGSSSDLTSELVEFFLSALDFRAAAAQSDQDDVCIDMVELPVIEALLAIVLKLSESTFRPLYYRLYDWALQNKRPKERAITFYRLSSHIAKSLKNLFGLFAGHFVTNAAHLLDKNNTEKTMNTTGDVGWFKNGDSVKKSCELIDAILSTLLTVFKNDSHQFVNKERFDALAQPLVDQLENQLGGDEARSTRNKLLTECLGEMALSIGDDALWKQLNYQILLKTRHSLPQVRMVGLKTVFEVVQKLNENFIPLLPETVPFLAELLEDDEEDIEKEGQRIVSEMETILGEPIQKYF